MSSIFEFSGSRNISMEFLQICHVWTTSKIQVYFSTSGSGGTDDCVIWIFPLFMFSRSSNPLAVFLSSYLVWVISKTWANFRSGGTRRYWLLMNIVCLMDFHNFSLFMFLRPGNSLLTFQLTHWCLSFLAFLYILISYFGTLGSKGLSCLNWEVLARLGLLNLMIPQNTDSWFHIRNLNHSRKIVICKLQTLLVFQEHG